MQHTSQKRLSNFLIELKLNLSTESSLEIKSEAATCSEYFSNLVKIKLETREQIQKNKPIVPHIFIWYLGSSIIKIYTYSMQLQCL